VSKRRVVVTGLGAITPVGNDVATTWSALVGGQSGTGPISKFDASAFPVKFAAEVKGFEPSQYMDRKEARRYDPYTQYAIAAAVQAMNDAGLGQSLTGPRAIPAWWFRASARLGYAVYTARRASGATHEPRGAPRARRMNREARLGRAA
jgi:hypothetical protein